MSGIQPITIEEQNHYLALRSVKRIATKVPAKFKARRLDGPAVKRTLVTFGKPENLPGFKFPIGSTVYTANGKVAWTVVSQAETPAGTCERSYGCSAGKQERVFGEDALHSNPPAPATKLKFVEVRLNKASGEIEPVAATITPAQAHARKELRSMLEASIAPTLAPSIDEPALFTVEPMTSKFETVVTFKRLGKSSSPAPKAAGPSAPKVRLNAPFAPTAIVSNIVANNPKKIGSKTRDRFALYVSGQTVAQAIASGITMADIKYDKAHGFIKVE